MSAERLREAAALMRVRAEALVSDPGGGPWLVESRCYCEVYDDAMESGGCKHKPVQFDLRVPSRGTTVVSHRGAEIDHEPEATHIASWHPAVALVVADWLDDTAEFFFPTSAIWGRALAVADAYLGATDA